MLFFVNCALLFYYFASLCPYFVDFSNATYIVSNTTPSSLLTSSFSSPTHKLRLLAMYDEHLAQKHKRKKHKIPSFAAQRSLSFFLKE